jgi:hypothetical protein
MVKASIAASVCWCGSSGNGTNSMTSKTMGPRMRPVVWRAFSNLCSAGVKTSFCSSKVLYVARVLTDSLNFSSLLERDAFPDVPAYQPS